MVTTKKIARMLKTLIKPLGASVACLYTLKTSEKPLRFLMFSGSIEKQHRALMG